MILPSTLKNKTEWVFVGPMGPELQEHFYEYPLICIDGGAHFAQKMDIWVGDADSYLQTINSQHIFKLPVDKDHSDLAMALSLFSEPRHYKFHFWGLLGGRRDHELFNLGESLSFLEKNGECQILFYNGAGNLTYHLVGKGLWQFTHEGTFSIGTLKKTDVKLTGEVRYPIARSTTLSPLSSLGLSNVGSGPMTLETSGPVFLYFPEDS